MNPELIRRRWEENPRRVARAFTTTLRDFGYSSLTQDWVETEIKRLYEGEEPKAGPSMFLKSWLEDGLD